MLNSKAQSSCKPFMPKSSIQNRWEQTDKAGVEAIWECKAKVMPSKPSGTKIKSKAMFY
jgi:hypothetical protein